MAINARSVAAILAEDLSSDVDHESVAQWVEAISPVPGGVWPITDVWLLSNTVAAASR
ncbi:MAG: hypothetical protein GY724_03955 [Actinomycetia bacterium]|nr:hypothetical protein [Actinomycetes bacterium]MCP5034390.1 hypothetical protein [Actinomycetes bacterium]